MNCVRNDIYIKDVNTEMTSDKVVWKMKTCFANFPEVGQGV